MIRKSVLALVVVVVVSVPVTIAVAGDIARAPDPDPADQPVGPPTTPQQPVSAVEAPQASSFGVLASEAAGVPDGVRAKLGSVGLDTEHGVNVELARGVDAGLSRGRVWILPGRDTVCLAQADVDGYGIACNTTEAAQDGLLYNALTDENGRPYSVAGVVPDGTTTVTVTTEGGKQVPLPVVDNVFATETPGVTGLRVDVPDGQRTVRFVR